MKIVLILGIIHMVAHELGHVTAALAFGLKIKRVGISWRGMYVVRQSAQTLSENLIVVFAGPLQNFGAAALTAYMHSPYWWVPLYIGVFNLMPVPHSDMSQAIKYIRFYKEARANGDY